MAEVVGVKVPELPRKTAYDDSDLLYVVSGGVDYKMQMEDLKDNVKPDTFDGATSLTPGEEGLVPAPTVEDVNKVLGSNGSWVDVDSTPTENSTNPLSSGGAYTALAGKADADDIPVIEANPSGEATEELSKLKVNTTIYKILATKVHGEASGDLITIDDAMQAPAVELSVTLEPQQAGTGDPSPENVRPISGWTECKVQRTGANLYPHNGISSYSYSYATQQTFEQARNPFFMKGGAKYIMTISGNIPLYRMRAFDVNKQLITHPLLINAKSNNGQLSFYSNYNFFGFNGTPNGTITFEPTVDMWFDGVTQDVQTSTVMLNTGETALPYEPYNGTTYTINLGGTYYGIRVNADGTGEVTHRYVDLGAFTWTYVNNSIFRANTSSPCKFVSQYQAINAKCEIYKVVAQNSLADSCISCNYSSASESQFYVKYTRFTDATAFKTAVTGKYFCYELATPIPLTLTPTQIDLLRGVNNLWSDGEVYVKYLRDLDIFLNDLARTVADHEARITALENPNND